MTPDTPQSPEPTSPASTKTKFRRYDVKKLLADPELRRKLIVQSTIATQAREGIDVSEADAEDSYYVVTQAERAAFIDLDKFTKREDGIDERHEVFIKSLSNHQTGVRTDATLRDFALVEGAALTYAEVSILTEVYRGTTKFDKNYADVRGGMNSTESARFVRCFWEPATFSQRKWVRYCKGGDFARFYSDLHLVLDWTENGRDLKELVKERYGSESRFIKSPEFYFKPGLTWTEKSSLGFSVRILEEGAIFNVAGPCAFPRRAEERFFLLGVLNSSIVAYTAKAISGRNFGSQYIAQIPIPPSTQAARERIAELAQKSYETKRAWDCGNEISSAFVSPWLLLDPMTKVAALSDRLLLIEERENKSDEELTSALAQIDRLVVRLYGLSEQNRTNIIRHLGSWPRESAWPQMEGKDRDQKRREHVDRLLTYLVKQVVTADEDRIVCLQRVAHEPPLIERVRTALAACFPEQDPSALETEVVNELKKKTKGYHRAESLAEWLHDVFFPTHNALYQQRPLLWHLASSQTRTVPGFACIVHAHHFDADALAKLRSVYLKDRVATLKREAAQAGNDGKADLRLDLLALLEEVEAYDAKLALLQEGAHTGPEGGERDYRILTPWKSPGERPQGWQPEVDDGIKVNLAPLARTNLLRRRLKLGEVKEED